MPDINDLSVNNPASKQAQLDALKSAQRSKAATPAAISSPQILNRGQLAAYLGLCPRSIQNLERRGMMPRIKLGKRTVYRLDSVLTALKKLEISEVA